MTIIMLNKITNRMYFDNDEDFYRFAVVPAVVIKSVNNPNGTTRRYFDFELSSTYKNAVDNGQVFIIKDPNSQIYKHQAVSYRTITKPIQNLYEYCCE